MLFTQIRHATCIIEFSGTRFLVDPILYKKNTLDPVKGGIDEKIRSKMFRPQKI